MPIHRFADLTYPEVEDLADADCVAILPIGATEAHGPHLPLCTDVVLAEGMAERAAERLAAEGLQVVLLPALVYTSAPFAAGFAGTLSVRSETVTALLVDIVESLWKQGFPCVAWANSHFDPEHLGSLYAAAGQLEDGVGRLVFPDVTRRSLAERLTEEFRSGACHAGRYEGSMVLARSPHLVRLEVQRDLPPLPISLPEAMREGKATFEELGAPRAYVGDPASATAEEGSETLERLGEILAEAVLKAPLSDRR
ncbi:MAG: creatininase family protein [Thermoanaerobaculia bacterium]|nr:creatininase family protein [Thermoanaerobaculia bacterium]